MTKLNRHIILTVVIGCIVCVVSNLFGGFQYQNLNEGLRDFLMYQLYAFALGFSNIFFFNYLENKPWNRNDKVKRIVFGIVGAAVITLLGLLLARAITAVLLKGGTLLEFLQEERLEHYQFGFWMTLTVVTIFYIIYYYNKRQQNKIKEQKFIAGTASAKFDALKNQLDPHFLFNSLNVLTSLIEENPENAQKFTTSLSKVYRYVLEQKDKELVLVDEELEFAKTYMSLLKMRFEDSIIFEMPEKASNPESKVVPLSLQLLLENAVKHNMVTTSKPLHIKIYEDGNYLVVENNLQPKDIVKKSSGVGLSNIMQRYDLLTTKKININKEATRFGVAIPMLTKQLFIMNTQHTEMEDSYIRARNHVEELKNFYYNLISYICVIPFLIYINYQTFWGFQWFWFPMIGWGIGLLAHAFRVYVSDSFLGSNWEKRKIEEYMRQEDNEKRWN